MAPASVDQVLASPGRELPSELRARFEDGFAADFSRVRVHTDPPAERSADAVGARAYTVANHIVFSRAAPAPDTAAGRELLAHELAHVIQQRDATAPVQPGSVPIDNTHEADANRAADAALRRSVAPSAGSRHDAVAPPVRAARRASRVPAVQRQGVTAPTSQTPAPVKTRVISHGASQAAVTAAEAQMREVFGALKGDNLRQLAGETIELHIIPVAKKLTDLPEYAGLKGTQTWDKKRVYDDIRGAGGTKQGSVIRYAIAEEELTSVPGHAMTYAPGFVGTHESGHLVQDFALTQRQRDDVKAAYNARVKAGGPWLAPAAYTSGNVQEYFAQGTAAYFGHPYSAGDQDKKNYTKDWLRKNDPALFKVLDEVYGAPAAPPRMPPSVRPRTNFNDKMQRDVENL